jgi:hypothetical protein
MKKLLGGLAFCVVFSVSLPGILHTQMVDDTIRYIPDNDELDMLVFMNMMGFGYHKFQLNSNTSGYLDIYIEEYLNDSLIDSYNHIESNRDEIAKIYYPIVFPKIDTSTKLLRVYTLSNNDSLEVVRFRIGEFALVKKLKVNKTDFDYSFKLTNFNNNIGPKCEMGSKIPLMYYATAVDKNIDGSTISAFCDIPNILNNRHLIENQSQIKHYFIIGIELVNEI